MRAPLEPVRALRVCSCLTARSELLPEVEARLSEEYGAIALHSPPYPFDISDYYRDEMGENLTRTWYCFRELCEADALAAYRLATGRIEDELAVDGRRRVNLDPGYLDAGKLVLTSLKEAPDKIYLGRGVWAHTCLRYRFGGFVAPDHSFPDFRDGRFDAFMLEARALLKRLLHEAG